MYRENKNTVEEISRYLQRLIKLTNIRKAQIILDQAILNLNSFEFKDMVTIYEVALVVQKIEMVMRIINVIENM